MILNVIIYISRWRTLGPVSEPSGDCAFIAYYLHFPKLFNSSAAAENSFGLFGQLPDRHIITIRRPYRVTCHTLPLHGMGADG